jgi:carbamate kinase
MVVALGGNAISPPRGGHPADPAFARPTKPVGAVLSSPPAGVPSMRAPDGAGGRRVVASPSLLAVIEQEAIGSAVQFVEATGRPAVMPP